MEQLPPNPPTIRTLRDDELTRLKENSITSSSLHTLADCVTCSGKQKFLWRKDLTSGYVDFECSCKGQYVLSRYLLHSGLDLRYQRFDWYDAEPVEEAAKTAVVNYYEAADRLVPSGIGMFLYGSRGTGKSLLASLLMKDLISRGYDCFFATFPYLVQLYSQQDYKNPEHKIWFEQRVINTPVLVIDDLGREFNTSARSKEMLESFLDHILRSRVSGCRPTIITSNRDLEWIDVTFQRNISSLMTGNLIFHEFQGDDYRKQDKERVIAEALAGVRRPVMLG